MGRDARKRRTRKAASRANRRAASRSVPTQEEIIANVLSDARGIADDGLLAAEAYASGVRGVTARALAEQPEVDEAFHDDLAAYLRRKATPDALALLLALKAIGGAPRVAADADWLISHGVRQPAWAGGIGQERFTGAWIATDEFGDQDFVVIGFETPEGSHTFTALVDQNLGGLLKDVMLAPEAPATILQTWREVPDNDLEPREIPAEEASRRLSAAILAYDQTFDPPSTDAVRSHRQLLLARLTKLPTPLPLPEPPRMSDDEREALVDEFLASPHAPSVDGTDYLADRLIDFKVDYLDGDPLRWSPTVVELCLLDWFPRKVLLEEDDVAAVPEVIRGWVRFAGERRGISSAGIDETLTAVATFEPEFVDLMASDTAAGPAKAIATALRAQGVDLTDKESVERWVAEFNDRPDAERDALLGGLEFGSAGSDELGRWRLAIPDVSGVFDEIELGALNPLDEDDRSILFAAEHQDNPSGLHGDEANEELHLTMHGVIANQLLADDPPDVWQTAQRLFALGYDRHTVLHMLAYAMSGVIYELLATPTREVDDDGYLAALEALPDSWLNFDPDGL